MAETESERKPQSSHRNLASGVCLRCHRVDEKPQFNCHCSDVFLSPAPSLAAPWRTAVEKLFLYVVLFVLGYFLWEQRYGIPLLFGLLFALLYLTARFFWPFGRVLHLWTPRIFCSGRFGSGRSHYPNASLDARAQHWDISKK